MSPVRLVLRETAEETLQACAQAVAAGLRAASAPHFVLAGGQTPRGVYTRLAAAAKDADAPAWHDVEFWFGDERCVGPDHPKSNFHLAQETLLRPLRIPGGHIHRMLGELGAEEGARRYAARIRARLGSQPQFTVVLIGLGPEGHTLSLFPESEGLLADDLAVAALVPTPPRERISLTPTALGAAERIFLLATGSEKRQALRAALGATRPDPGIPTSFLRGRIETVVFCDRGALPEPPTEVAP